MLYIIYEILIHVAFVVTLPYFLFKMLTLGKYSGGMAERLGSVSAEKFAALEGKKVAWFHAVSVGETRAALALLRRFRESYPEYKILFSTVTMTGNAIAKKEGIKLIDTLIYMPLDYSWAIGSVISRIRPSIFIVTEKEYWPNTMRFLSERSVPVIVVNGTVSEKSYDRYRIAGFLFKNVFSSIRLFCAQTAADEQRALALGVLRGNTAVTGNIKFDMAPSVSDEEKKSEIKKALGITGNELVLAAGSTHAGEEEAVLRVFKRLKHDMPELRLVIAPRHPERFVEVEEIIKKSGLTCIKRTKGGESAEVALLDTLGELQCVYSFCGVAFVGGSLVEGVGGHNLLEPAFFAKPVVYGAYVKNYTDMAASLEEKSAGFRTNGEDELYLVLKKLLTDESLRKASGLAARNFVEENSGTVKKTLDCMNAVLKPKGH